MRRGDILDVQLGHISSLVRVETANEEVVVGDLSFRKILEAMPPFEGESVDLRRVIVLDSLKNE